MATSKPLIPRIQATVDTYLKLLKTRQGAGFSKNQVDAIKQIKSRNSNTA